MPAKPKPPPDKGDLDVQLQIRLTPRLREKLRWHAFRNNRSLSSQARLLIEQGLKARRLGSAPPRDGLKP